ncbi:expressed unknown protein [Seminavis robusta]|uniref:DUF3730 domain-containing protein n=1 Tax=Seminavis robusta TaxID=568900 RepID=A0A9N8EAU9_9STRA|nr:expressed unknown protein [Seminavis robusta]|eukprot:Sro742_g195950.1 n/a (2101) ;mRNA; f:31015-37446
MADPPGERTSLPSPTGPSRPINSTSTKGSNRGSGDSSKRSSQQQQQPPESQKSQSQKQPHSRSTPPQPQQPQPPWPADANTTAASLPQTISTSKKSNSTQQLNQLRRREMEDRIGKLLTRLQRQFAAQKPSEQQSFIIPPRPPDQAAASLGKELAHAFIQTYYSATVVENDHNKEQLLEPTRHKILASLAQRGIHPSIPHAFFDQLVSPQTQQYNSPPPPIPTQQQPTLHYEWEAWLPNFILQCEQQIMDELPNGTSSSNNNNNNTHYGEECGSGLHETLAAALRAYALSSAQQAQLSQQHNQHQHYNQNRRRTSNSHQILTTTYRRLQSSAARTILVREFARAVDKNLQLIPPQLSSLLAACVLTMWATPHAEKTQLLQEIWRQCWEVIYASDKFGHFWHFLFWMTEALNLFLLALPLAAAQYHHDRPAWKELAQGWLMELGDMIAFVVHATTSDHEQNQQDTHSVQVSSERLLAEWIQLIMNNLLPILALQNGMAQPGLYRLSLEPLLEQLNGLIVEMDDSLVQLHTMVVFRLSTMALTTPLRGETKSILALFSYLLPSESPFARALTSTVGAIFMQDDTCKSAAKHLLKTVQGVDQQLMTGGDSSRGGSGSKGMVGIVQLLEEGGDDGQELLDFTARVNAHELVHLSSAKQVETLLLGICLMEVTTEEEMGHNQHTNDDDNDNDSNMDNQNTKSNTTNQFCDAARNFLKTLLQRYPHLGLLLTPSLISDINAAAVEKSPTELLGKLQFLADSVTGDPSCAQQVWNLLGVQMLDPNQTPVVLRCAVLRLLPRLCLVNKRLYRRVVDTLGEHRDGKNSNTVGVGVETPDSMMIQTEVMEIRLAVAASIVDLAKDDLIRDPADCIGWIQEFLVEDYSESPSKALLVHYAILALHYLVIAQELDFALVLKVMKKKLCAVTSIDEVQHLPPVIQEALALLLGDGECKEDSSDEEDDEGGKEPEVPDISPQVVGAVQVLIDLGIQFETIEADNETSVELIARIRRNIYYSLSRYSLDALGLDEDGVKATLSWHEEGGEASRENPPLTASRYMSLRKLAVNGMQLPSSFRELVDGFDTIILNLNSTVLQFEEEALASSLWKTKGTRHHVGQQRRIESNKALSKDAVSLPSPSKLQSLHKKMPSASSSVGRLLCFEGKSLSKFLALAGEVSFQEREPMTLVFLVQAWLNSCSRLLSHLYEGPKFRGLSQPLEEVRRWGLHTGNNDAMYFSMAALSLYVPKREDKNERMGVDQIQGEIWNAFRNLQFKNSDCAKISLALTAVTCLRWGFQERVFEIIGALEQSVKGYGGQISFGAAYGLAIIAQAISHTDRVQSLGGIGGETRTRSKIGQIVGFLVGELVACTGESNNRSDILTTLVACLQSGVSTPNLVGSLADSVSEQFAIPPAKIETVRYLMISLGLSLPSLSHVNGDLLLGSLFFLERFMWGSGKGIALVPVLHEAKSSGVLTEDEFDVIVSEYGRIFEQSLSEREAPDFSEDLFYAVNGASKNPSPHIIREFLTRTTIRFDDNRCTSPLVGAIVSVGSFPCLGFMSRIMTAPAQVRLDTPKPTSESVLEVVSGVLEAHTDYSRPDYSKTAVMLLGLLASMKNQPADISLSPSQDKPPSQTTQSKLKGLKLDFALLPGAAPGTLLYDIMSLMQRAHGGEQGDQTADMMRYMRCLESLSLPGHFAKHFLEPLISEDNDSTKEGCLALLSAQVNRQRGRNDFTNMALQISIMPLVSFNSLLGNGKAPATFVKCLVGVVRSLPAELVENGSMNLWQNCLSLSDDTNLLVAFLKSIQVILKSQGKSGKQSSLSPKTTKFLEHFVTKRIFSDLRELQWATSLGAKAAQEEGSILKGYVSCLTALPLSSLEEFDLFTFQEEDSFSGEVLRAFVVLELVRCRYFGDAARAKREISKVMAWFSRKFISLGAEMYVDTMRRVACAVAAATKVLTAPERREVLLSILEQLLLCQPSAGAIGVDLLSILVASWCSDVATDGDLSMAYVWIHSTDRLPGLSDASLGQVFAFFRHDLPFNLATYGRKEKIGAIVANQVWRLYSTWSKHGADEDVLKCLRKAFVCGSGSKEEDFVLLASSILLEADSAQVGQSLLG